MTTTIEVLAKQAGVTVEEAIKHLGAILNQKQNSSPKLRKRKDASYILTIVTSCKLCASKQIQFFHMKDVGGEKEADFVAIGDIDPDKYLDLETFIEDRAAVSCKRCKSKLLKFSKEGLIELLLIEKNKRYF